MRRRLGILIFCLLGAVHAGPGAIAQDYYQGKTIKVIVPFSPGGTYDRMARLAAKFMPSHIPGEPTMIVQNITGGGGMIGMRAAYGAEPDGLTLMHTSSLYAFRALLGQMQGIDFLKWGWLGSVGGANYVFFVRSDLPYRTVEEFRNAQAPVKVGVLGRGSSITGSAKIIKDFGKFNLRLVPGYKGYADIALAIRQGEVDGVSTAALTLQANSLTNSMYEEKFIRLVLSLGGAAPPPQFADAIAELPKLRNFITNETDLEAYDTFISGLSITRPFATSPNTPENLLTILRQGFSDMTRDPEFIAAAEKNGFVLNPVGPEAVDSQIKSIFQLPKPVEARLEEVFK